MADLEKRTILESDLAAALGLDDWEHPADLLSIVRALKLGDEEAAAALDEHDRLRRQRDEARAVEVGLNKHLDRARYNAKAWKAECDAMRPVAEAAERCVLVWRSESGTGARLAPLRLMALAVDTWRATQPGKDDVTEEPRRVWRHGDPQPVRLPLAVLDSEGERWDLVPPRPAIVHYIAQSAGEQGDDIGVDWDYMLTFGPVTEVGAADV